MRRSPYSVAPPPLRFFPVGSAAAALDAGAGGIIDMNVMPWLGATPAAAAGAVMPHPFSTGASVAPWGSITKHSVLQCGCG